MSTEVQQVLVDVRAEAAAETHNLLVTVPYRTPKAFTEAARRQDRALDGKVRVSTIDSYQGSEADIVFFSLVRTRVRKVLKQ